MEKQPAVSLSLLQVMSDSVACTARLPARSNGVQGVASGAECSKHTVCECHPVIVFAECRSLVDHARATASRHIAIAQHLRHHNVAHRLSSFV